MAENPIPETLRCDHLILLVGTNPLPNWIAIRLLLKEKKTGRIYLVHSDVTLEIARRLAKLLLSQGYQQAEYVYVMNASDPREVYHVVCQCCKTIKSGQVGFNYTGGTKVMSVHGYRAVEKELPPGLPVPIFSYLDALTLYMYFDEGYSRFVGTDPCVYLNLKELLALHDDYNSPSPNQEPILLPVVLELEKLHRTEAAYKAWRKWTTELQNPKKPGAKKAEDSTLEDLHKTFPEVAVKLLKEAELAHNEPSTITWKELVRQNNRFSNASDLINWLEGRWLESYVLNLLRNPDFKLNDYGQGFAVNTKRLRFEADVAAIRGYQLHFISCYSGHSPQTCTFKLFESFIRARQIGGDEAGAALVCMSENPKSIEYDVAQAWQDDFGRIKVFGRRELENLKDHLLDWFRTGIPPEYL